MATTHPVAPAAHHHLIWAALAELTDPEIPVVTLRELGVLREVRNGADGTPEVVITPTYNGCPAMEQIETDVRAALAGRGIVARVVTQLAPAWTTDWLSDAARDKLRAYGIAPPQGDSGAHPGHAGANGRAGNVIRLAPRQAHPTKPIPCPQCGSVNTTETSHFGSTACKALYRCLDCLEPFDYFKPY